MKRRQFLSRLALIPLSITAPHVFSDSFDEFLKSQHIEAEKVKDDFQSYQENYLDSFEQYKRALAEEWQAVEISDQDIWVTYGKNLKTKTVVDFVRNEIRISYKSANPSETLNTDLAHLLNLSEYQAIVDDPTNNSALHAQEFSDNKRKLLSELNAFYGNSDNARKQLKKVAIVDRIKTSKGDVTTVTLPLPKQLPFKRAEKYLASAKRAAKKWNIDPALVMAIAHTESHFNPLARSHIPAFGLMQIVPASAGKDASKLMTGKTRLLTSTELYDADFNLETGSAYLNLLQTRYLKGINNPTSRMYCVIAAYNTGSGNVAKAFVGTASMQAAFNIINQLPPERVYDRLKKELPYAETRRYIIKVMAHRKTYQQII